MLRQASLGTRIEAALCKALLRVIFDPKLVDRRRREFKQNFREVDRLFSTATDADLRKLADEIMTGLFSIIFLWREEPCRSRRQCLKALRQKRDRARAILKLPPR